MADGGIRLLSNIGQLQPRRNSNDVPAGLATFAAVESLFEPAVADASALLFFLQPGLNSLPPKLRVLYQMSS